MSQLANRPFHRFGRFLKDLREGLGLTGKSFWDSHSTELGVTYGQFASFERGERLPNAALAVKLASLLNVDRLVMLLNWASAASIDKEIGRTFLELIPKTDPEQKSSAYQIQSASIPVAEFDNTWVLGPVDYELMDEDLGLFDFLVLLEMTWPERQGFDRFGFSNEQEFEAFLNSKCERWIREGRISVDKNGVQMVLPHFHLPKTEEWRPLRTRIVNRFVAEALPQLTPENLKAKLVHRTMTTRFLTKEQRIGFAKKLAALESEFFSITADRSNLGPELTTVSLLILMGRHEMKFR